MATSNKYFSTTYTAAEDLSGSQYKAFADDDGKVANLAHEAVGIILNKPVSGDEVSVGYIGEMKFYAGGAIAVGDKITSTTSGWFTECASGLYALGVAKAAVTSGSIGTGLFNFPSAGTLISSLN